jgi:hypothetical protein
MAGQYVIAATQEAVPNSRRQAKTIHELASEIGTSERTVHSAIRALRSIGERIVWDNEGRDYFYWRTCEAYYVASWEKRGVQYTRSRLSTMGAVDESAVREIGYRSVSIALDARIPLPIEAPLRAR